MANTLRKQKLKALRPQQTSPQLDKFHEDLKLLQQLKQSNMNAIQYLEQLRFRQSQSIKLHNWEELKKSARLIRSFKMLVNILAILDQPRQEQRRREQLRRQEQHRRQEQLIKIQISIKATKRKVKLQQKITKPQEQKIKSSVLKSSLKHSHQNNPTTFNINDQDQLEQKMLSQKLKNTQKLNLKQENDNQTDVDFSDVQNCIANPSNCYPKMKVQQKKNTQEQQTSYGKLNQNSNNPEIKIIYKKQQSQELNETQIQECQKMYY